MLVKNTRIVGCYFFFISFLFVDCKKKNVVETNPPVVPPAASSFAKGADVGWLTEMESAGKKFYTAAGVEMECMALLKSLGMN